MSKTPLITCKNIEKSFNVTESLFAKKRLSIKALKNVNFKIYPKEVVGLVGESGSGKSTLAKIIADIYKPDSGKILYKDKNINEIYQEFRKNVQMVFQDPYSSLNPKLKIISTLKDGVKNYLTKSKVEIENICKQLIKSVGLEEDHLYRYPHQFSGGQRQRISIARALSTDPELILGDEPVSALDVSVQAEILNLFKKLNIEKNKSILLISHDLAVVYFLCHYVYVIYKGVIVEHGKTDKIIKSPLHPYTKQLLLSKDLTNFSTHRKIDNTYCPLAEKCPNYSSVCDKELEEIKISDGHFIKCHNIK
ncbi:phosphate-transporting ATPase [Deferribacter desulfuricans SSM1]|uniref:Phosphate-transporting ATPase n=1 Tax=Deferribacter desulfuricans (strain DSM 14783 / JCM 11476 / NBRC 101012 / SSM1) TaxID=639282 RepID=D3PCJ2_DEFDS|nr:ATP-binding cassette domain-containing protein [Deferribacter desulfuricans]BAI80315.1 phosphate-transporting ATPase [Deferribacter desulfuricans SSM1]